MEKDLSGLEKSQEVNPSTSWKRKGCQRNSDIEVSAQFHSPTKNVLQDLTMNIAIYIAKNTDCFGTRSRSNLACY